MGLQDAGPAAALAGFVLMTGDTKMALLGVRAHAED